MSGNLADLVRDAARARPDHPALRYDGDALTWAALDDRVSTTASGLLGLGLAPGDRVALELPNSPELAVCYFATLRAGLVAVPVNPGYTGPELAHVLTDSGARVLVTDPLGAGTALALAAPPEHLLVAGDAPPGARPLSDVPSRSGGGSTGSGSGTARGGEDLAVVLYTSGTSGRSRGAMLPHRALLANLAQLAAIEPRVMTDEDVVLLVLPLFHVYGLNAGLGMVAWHGATGVLVERFDPAATLELVGREQVTNLVAAPQMFHAWSGLPGLGEALAGVRLAVSGSAPLPPTVLRTVLETTGHHVFEGYGLTETSPVLTTTLRSEVPRPGSIGRPVPGVELRLLAENGYPVDEGDVGEIVVRGPNLFAGYWPDGADGPDELGWWATGDLAYADTEGDLHLVDRRRELVLVSGFNVYPREVEDVLLSHPQVAEAAVLGLPDPATGQAVSAVVVARPGTAPTPEELLAHCARSLARFKCPTSIRLVEQLPHTATGKVSKAKLREERG